MSFKTERSPEFHQTLKWIITTVRIPVVLPQQPSGLPPGLTCFTNTAELLRLTSSRGGRESSYAAGLQVLRDTKGPWNLGRARCHTSYVPLWPLFSHPAHPSPLVLSSLSVPCAVPIPCVSWFCTSLNPDPSHHLLSLCSLLLTTAPFHKAAPSSPSSRTQSRSSSKTNPSTSPHQPFCWLFTLFFPPLRCPYKARGALSEQERASLPLVLLWRWPLRRAIPPSIPQSPRALQPAMPGLGGHRCAGCTCRQKLWGHERYSLQGEYLENAIINRMYKKVRYFEDARFKSISLGTAKGIHFKSPLQSMEALQLIKKQLEKFTLDG